MYNNSHEEEDGYFRKDLVNGGKSEYFGKSPWIQDGVSVNRFDQTEKSVDKYLQAVLDRY